MFSLVAGPTGFRQTVVPCVDDHRHNLSLASFAVYAPLLQAMTAGRVITDIAPILDARTVAQVIFDAGRRKSN